MWGKLKRPTYVNTINRVFLINDCGEDGSRTHDLLTASQAL